LANLVYAAQTAGHTLWPTAGSPVIVCRRLYWPRPTGLDEMRDMAVQSSIDSINHRNYLALAIPFTVSNITQPLLGAVDTAVIGRLDDPAFIGGVALGTVVFNTMYWLFGFLRVSTSGFSAQSLGSNDEQYQYFAYFRPLLFAVAISLALLLLQIPIKQAALLIYDPEPGVTPHIITYFDIVIWGAPLVLTGYVNLGWLMGRRLVRETLFLQISTNLLNILLDLVFVLVLKMGVAGVAWATLIAQIYAFSLGFYVISNKLELIRIIRYKAALLNRAAMKKIIGVNRDLMIRTFCLLAMTNLFMAKGSELGVEILAANAVLFQLQYLMAYLFDGMGNAASIFAGKSLQQKNQWEFQQVFNITTLHTGFLAVALSLIVWGFHDHLIWFFTDINEVIILCKQYIIWLVIFPLVIGLGLVFYGIYTGATHTAPVRDSLIMSLLVFVAVYLAAIPFWGNHGLWLAFTLFSLTRSVYLLVNKSRFIAALFDTPDL
jgi:MATE family multidrug resistance protein